MRTLVLCLNPAVDAEWKLDHIHWEEKNTVLHEHRWAGGKGVNVARWLKFLGTPTQLLIPLGGAPGKELRDYLRADGIPLLAVNVEENSRVNVVVTSVEGRQIRFNQMGPRLTARDWQRVRVLLRRGLGNSACVICSGSLPKGAPVGTYADIVRSANKRGVRAVVDCDGPCFVAAVKARPFLVKPNEHELSQWHGGALKNERAVLAAARALSRVTRGWVLVSRGAKGALLVHAAQEVALSARAPRITVRNTVGAGDALLSAALGRVAAGARPEDWLRWGVAMGSAAAQQVGGNFPKANSLRRLAAAIEVKDLAR